MQRAAPEGALGRVFVRYEVLFQLAWVAGAFLPGVLPIAFRTGILILARLLPAARRPSPTCGGGRSRRRRSPGRQLDRAGRT